MDAWLQRGHVIDDVEGRRRCARGSTGGTARFNGATSSTTWKVAEVSSSAAARASLLQRGHVIDDVEGRLWASFLDWCRDELQRGHVIDDVEGRDGVRRR